ncbi:MAG: methyltransferase domain-containing protein [Rhizobiales bacterium]|nr:methyltransferase domain-containing protein [Hyphomicrobiales bacterium]
MTVKVDKPRANRTDHTSATVVPQLPKPEWGPRLPYFDVLLSLLEKGDSSVEAAFGRHVHWGFWPDPRSATGDAADYAMAAERLCIEVCAGANITNGQLVLDVGCGFGGTIASLNERFQHMRFVGLNIDQRQIARAKARVTPRGDNLVTFVAGTASSLPLPDASCDTVVAVEAIFHFPDRAQFFGEAHRVLKPGGRLSLSDYLPQHWMQPALWLKVPSFHFGDFDVRYSLERYRRLANEVGFRLVIERDINANTLPTFDFLESLKPLVARFGKQVVIETRMLRWISRLRLLCYGILAFEKS